MSGPARAGALIFAKDVERLADFYCQVLQMKRLHAKPELLVLQSPDMQLVIHAIPTHIAETFEISSPPEPREEAAIKLFFTVPSIEWAREVVAGLGGVVHDQVWQGKGFAACNAIDPEGNVFQIRESAGAAGA
jgi:predicted enzyme related to lactoylglutathione lyase